jgi:membrane protease YdiL (CAAX protease family)
MPSLTVGLRATAIYFAVIACATAYSFVLSDPPGDTIQKLWRLLPLQLILVGFCLAFIFRYLTWQTVGFGRVEWRAVLWLLPSMLAMALMIRDIMPTFLTVGWVGLCLLILVPLLVGFSEEVMFRGILLRSAMARLPVAYAMLLSAVVFALMHVLNGIITQSFWPTLQQTALAFCVGFFLAPIAIKVGNLWPLIIWHAAWNMIVFASQIANIMHPLALFGIFFQAVISVWLWADLARTRRP